MLWLSRNPRTNGQKKRPPNDGLRWVWGILFRWIADALPRRLFNWLEVDTSAGEHEVEVLQGRIDPLAS